MKILEREVTLKNGTLKYKEDEFGHSYWSKELGYLPSVTTILAGGMPVDEYLLDWFKRSDFETLERKRDDALEHGSGVHNIIYELNKAEKVDMIDVSQRTKKEIASYGQWVREWRPQTLTPEQIIYYFDDDIYFAGTVDLVCEIDGKRVLVDFKTSKVIGIKDYLQVIAYAKAWEQAHDEKIDETMILQLGTKHRTINKRTPILGKPSNGEGWAVHLVDRETYSFEDFKRVYDMFKFVNKGEIPQPPEMTVYPDSVQLFTEKGDFNEANDFINK